MSDKTHIVLDIRSDQRTEGDSNIFEVMLNKTINFNKLANKERTYSLRIENIILPVTFYQIDSNYDTFLFDEYNGVTTNSLSIQVTHGNYTASDLIAELESKMDVATAQGNNYLITFSDITGKITIAYSGGASTTVTVDSYTNGSTLNPFLGFSEVISTDTTTTVILTGGTEAPNAVNLTIKDSVYIDTDIQSHNHINKKGKISLGAFVPINVDRGQKVHFTNEGAAKIRYSQANNIDHLNVRLLDPFGKAIDLNGLPYSFQMVWYEDK